MRQNGEKVMKELLKIFSSPPFSVILRVNKMRKMEVTEGEIFPSISLHSP